MNITHPLVFHHQKTATNNESSFKREFMFGYMKTVNH